MNCISTSKYAYRAVTVTALPIPGDPGIMRSVPTHATDSAETAYYDLVVGSFTDLMRAIIEAQTPDAFQQVAQAYYGNLRPSLEPADCPKYAHRRLPFSDVYTADEEKYGRARIA
jgi:hypothetical protein